MSIRKKALATSLGLLTLTLGISKAMAAGDWGDYDPANTPVAGSIIGPHKHCGFFVGAYGGVTALSNTDLDAKMTHPLYVSDPSAPQPLYNYPNTNMTLDSNTGFNGGILFGYDYKLLRVEGQLDAMRADADTVKGVLGLDSNTTYTASGNTSAYSAFANVLLNVKEGPVNLFAGGGVGGLYQDYDINTASGGLYNPTLNDGAMTVAFQGIAGLGYSFNDQWELDVMYRYVGAPSATLKVTDEATYTSAEYTPTYASNNIDIALRYFVA